jgi:Dipeptidyl peptidase IV (DPP IV) N-terminal region
MAKAARPLALAPVLVLAIAAPARATFAGTNGRIAFYSNRPTGDGIYEIQPDGSGETFITQGHQPTWSADGQKIAFVRAGDIWVMDANGGNQIQITNSGAGDTDPAWTPSGQFIVFRRASCQNCTPAVFAAPSDGSGGGNFVVLDPPWPDWVFDSSGRAYGYSLSPGDVWIVSGDSDVILKSPPSKGSCCATTIATGISGKTATWSPDGTKLAYLDGNEIHTMNEAGNDRIQLTSDGFAKAEIGWQAVPPTPTQPSYVRPKSASPTRVSLVPAYRQCTASNLTHGPPLGFPSCSPPQQTSVNLTVGTPDSNGKPAESSGFVKLTAVPGDPSTTADEADVKINASVTDVRCRTAISTCTSGALSAYTGALQIRFDLRLTDLFNGGLGTEPATTDIGGSQLPFKATVPCTAGSGDTGASCSVSTTAEAIVPRAVTEGKRAVWQLGQVEVYDGGRSGTAGAPDAALFMDQGVFVP